MSRVANSLSYQQLENADMAKNFRVVGPKLRSSLVMVKMKTNIIIILIN